MSHTYRDLLKQSVPLKRSLKSLKCDKVKGFFHLYDCNNYNLISSIILYSLNKGKYDILTKKKEFVIITYMAKEFKIQKRYLLKKIGFSNGGSNRNYIDI